MAWQEHPCDSKSSKRMHRVFLARETLTWGVSGFQSNLWSSPGQAVAVCRASPSPLFPPVVRNQLLRQRSRGKGACGCVMEREEVDGAAGRLSWQ